MVTGGCYGRTSDFSGIRAINIHVHSLEKDSYPSLIEDEKRIFEGENFLQNGASVCSWQVDRSHSSLISKTPRRKLVPRGFLVLTWIFLMTWCAKYPGEVQVIHNSSLKLLFIEKGTEIIKFQSPSNKSCLNMDHAFIPACFLHFGLP